MRLPIFFDHNSAQSLPRVGCGFFVTPPGKEGKSGAKTDDIDAFAIACWYFDKPETSYLKIRDPLVSQIERICLRIEHLNRLQSPIINRMRQELAWQCPEVALVRSVKLQDELAPLL